MDLTFSSLDHRDINGRSALSWVAQQGKEDVVNQLLLCKADPNNGDSTGRTPLHWAVVAHSVSCVESLIIFGADIFMKDKLGSTAIHLAVQGNPNLYIVQALIASGADLRIRDGQGMTPLHMAAYYDHPDVVSRLLANGAQINDTDSSGRTALLIAISLNNYGVLRLLLNHSSLNCAVVDNYERNVIHFAACLGDICTLRILTATNLKGLYIDDKDNSGVAGIQYAQWRLLHHEEWSNSVVEPRDRDPLEWYLAFRKFNDSIRYNSTNEISDRSPDEDPYTWDSLQRDLSGLNLSDDEEDDSEDQWADALEEVLNDSAQSAWPSSMDTYRGTVG